MGYLFALLVTVVLAVGGYGYYVTADLPPVEVLLSQRERQTENTSSKIVAGDGHTIILSNGRFRQDETKYDDIAPSLIDALLATEDRRFFTHHGVDPIGISRALISNLTNKGLNEGASTITQQLVRNYFLTNERSFKRKFREIVLAYQLEQLLSKEQILEKYLNTIYFGEGAYGIEAASRIYFSKSARALTLRESALLAGLPQAPSRYNPFYQPELAKNRRNEVLMNLVEAGKITRAEADETKKLPLGLNPIPNRRSMSDKVPYFNRFVQQRLMEWFGLSEQEFWQSGFQVYTTLDLKAQRIAEQAVQALSQQYGRTGKKQQAALLSVKNNTGAILAYVGGRDFNDSQYDRVALAKRSPGSLFKMFTYAAAFEKGYLPTDSLVDEPISYGNWTPQNYDKSHYGMMSLAQAFITSNNVIAVKLLYELGPEFVVQLAKSMGVTSELKPFLSLTLGGSSVTLIDMVSGAQTISNQGVWVKPYAIERIVDRRGELIYRHEPQTRDALSPTTTHTMTRMMQEVVLNGTGRRGNFGKPAAGKTGTSDDHRDAWFVGFTPHITTGVWVGNDDNSPMKGKISGGSMPTELWRRYMQGYSVYFPLQDFDISHARTLEGPAWGEPAPEPQDNMGAPPLGPVEPSYTIPKNGWENQNLPDPSQPYPRQGQGSRQGYQNQDALPPPQPSVWERIKDKLNLGEDEPQNNLPPVQQPLPPPPPAQSTRPRPNQQGSQGNAVNLTPPPPAPPQPYAPAREEENEGVALPPPTPGG